MRIFEDRDLVYIDTDLEGGILAGSDPGSVLFAVYRFLKLNGCRFFAPGVDGEFVPRKKHPLKRSCHGFHKLIDQYLAEKPYLQ
jgi:hypothetical protein